MTTAVIAIHDVSTRFGDVWVHRHLDLAVSRGEMVALVGGSGSGKTTLLRQIVGLLAPTQGEIRLFGEPLFDGDVWRERAHQWVEMQPLPPGVVLDAELRIRCNLLLVGATSDIVIPVSELRHIHEILHAAGRRVYA